MSPKEIRYQKAEALTQQFADKGYIAMYGGRKGHGFWIYKVATAERAHEFNAHPFQAIPAPSSTTGCPIKP